MNPGYYLDPTETLYQRYLSGGWASVDSRIKNDVRATKEIGAKMVMGFMYGTPNCTVPTQSQLDAYADFIVAAADRYDISYIEVCNEPDAASGLPSLYGCFGHTNANLLNNLLDRVRNQLPTEKKVGVSFMLDNDNMYTMLQSAVPHAEWIGVHYYDVYAEDTQGNGVILNSYPGSLTEKLDMAFAAAGNKPVWLTETNLRSPMDFCTPTHKQFALDFIKNTVYPEVKARNIQMWSILVYQDYPNWQCTGIRNTPVHNFLKGRQMLHIN